MNISYVYSTLLGPIHTELSVNSYIENSGTHLLVMSLSRSLSLSVNDPLIPELSLLVNPV